ncbi:hypothetical protein L596_014159 [Steinernema carpocapsae]|uniref:Uncharacterized protein n=1 Tax=Steinernema carpocapsae TaxID=34508 RepID=A0A4U5NC81_STECR|nr:hypothetical protein L596_014159 [Steinernema carpocapsae]
MFLNCCSNRHNRSISTPNNRLQRCAILNRVYAPLETLDRPKQIPEPRPPPQTRSRRISLDSNGWANVAELLTGSPNAAAT